MNIFDMVTPEATVAYWTEFQTGEPPFLGEELVGTIRQKSTTLKSIKGATHSPVQLKQSAYDAKAVPRGRIGFETVQFEMPFFKESMYVDEMLQRELNEVLATGNQAYIDSVMTRIMNDNMTLLKSARLTREIMLWMALTTGVISMTSNGQNYTADYGVPSEHKFEVAKSWSDPTADIINDIINYQDIIESGSGGVRPTRLIVTRPSFNKITKNQNIKKTVFSAGSVDAYLSAAKTKEFLMAELGVDLVVYERGYRTSAGTYTKFIPDDMAILLPPMLLGDIVFAETPEESNLNARTQMNVAITDTAVAVTTMTVADPVTVETKVSQVCMPSLPQIDKVGMIDIEKA